MIKIETAYATTDEELEEELRELQLIGRIISVTQKSDPEEWRVILDVPN
jgi:hypothetical protein